MIQVETLRGFGSQLKAVLTSQLEGDCQYTTCINTKHADMDPLLSGQDPHVWLVDHMVSHNSASEKEQATISVTSTADLFGYLSSSVVG